MPGALPIPVGYSNISWPLERLNEALESVSALGFRGVQFLGTVEDVYSGKKLPELQHRLEQLKLSAAALSCTKVSLRPDDSNAHEAKFREYAGFLHSLGGKVLQLIDRGKPRFNYRDRQIQSLGAMMNELGKIAADSGMTVGYHPHYETLGETREGRRELWMRPIPGMSA